MFLAEVSGPQDEDDNLSPATTLTQESTPPPRRRRNSWSDNELLDSVTPAFENMCPRPGLRDHSPISPINLGPTLDRELREIATSSTILVEHMTRHEEENSRLDVQR